MMELSSMGRPNADRWIGVLEAEMAAYRQWKAARRRRMFWRAVVVIGLLALMLSGKHVGFFPFWVLFGGKMAMDTAADSRYTAAHEVAKLRNPRAVGVLAVTCREADGDVSIVAVRALKDTLPLVRANHRAGFTEEQMDALLWLLGTDDPELARALLKALEQVGGPKALPAVRRLEHHPSASVREAAAACALHLEAVAEQERLRATLLRAAEGPEGGDRLLRPASGAGDTPQEQLLRPSSGDDA